MFPFTQVIHRHVPHRSARCTVLSLHALPPLVRACQEPGRWHRFPPEGLRGRRRSRSPRAQICSWAPCTSLAWSHRDAHRQGRGKGSSTSCWLKLPGMLWSRAHGGRGLSCWEKCDTTFSTGGSFGLLLLLQFLQQSETVAGCTLVTHSSYPCSLPRGDTVGSHSFSRAVTYKLDWTERKYLLI